MALALVRYNRFAGFGRFVTKKQTKKINVSNFHYKDFLAHKPGSIANNYILH